MGFFTSSYLLFVSNFALPMLGFVYWHDATKSTRETAFNNVTIAGCIVGMVFFGVCADIFGRRKMYGVEIITVMIGTTGVVISSAGYVPLERANHKDPVDFRSFGSMNIEPWLLFWRFLSGLGIGGGFPLTAVIAVIASEYAPTLKRPRMLVMVFAMQSFSTTAAALVSLVVTRIIQTRHPYSRTDPEASARAIDQAWRWVFGLSLFPALITVFLRLTIPESPRYTLDVVRDPSKAFAETEKLKRLGPEPELPSSTNAVMALPQPAHNTEEHIRTNHITNWCDANGDPQSPSIRQYFWTKGNWRYLLATSVSWFLVDFGLFPFSLNQMRTLSQFWTGFASVAKEPKT